MSHAHPETVTITGYTYEKRKFLLRFLRRRLERELALIDSFQLQAMPPAMEDRRAELCSMLRMADRCLFTLENNYGIPQPV